MDITVLKEQIMKNELSNFYIFTGSEIGIQHIYLEQMSNVLNLPIVRANCVADVYSECTSLSLLGNSVNMYVIRDDTDFPKHEEVYTTISTDIGKNVIVLCYEKLDSRLKFGKYFKNSTVSFEKLSPSILQKYITKFSELSNENAVKLSNEVAMSYDLALLEIDKIKQYAQFESISQNDSYKLLSDSGVIYHPEETDVFKYVDSVCSRNRRLSFHLADVLAENNVSAINILGTLYSTMKNVMLIQCCEGSDISNITGLDNRQIYFNKKYVGRYDIHSLVHAVKLISQTISDVKAGLIDEKYAVRYTMVNIL